MFSQRSKRDNDPVPRRRSIDAAETESNRGAANPQFRRNQTLSSYRGSSSDPTTESARHKAHHLTVQRRKLGGIFLIVALVAIALALLLWQLIAQVRITTSSKQLTTSFRVDAYQTAMNEYFGVNPAQRLRVSLDEPALSAYVASQFPEVEKLELTGSPGIARGDFTVTFRQPVAGWQIQGKQYYVDTTGVVFEKNYYDIPSVQIIDESGVSPEQGSAIVGSRVLGFLGKVVARAGERGYTITQAALPRDTTRELDIYIEGVGPRIKLSIDRGAGEQLEDAARSINYLTSRGIQANYIDVRVAGRAAYR